MATEKKEEKQSGATMEESGKSRQAKPKREPTEQKQVGSSPFPRKFILGRKVGMGRIFASDGEMVPVTFIEAGPCTVTQIKTDKSDGYNAVQLAFGSCKEKHLLKPLEGHLKKSGLSTTRHLREVRVKTTEGIELGQQVKADIFAEGDVVNVVAVSRGLGFQGAVRRHNFSGGPKSHGQSDRVRAPGSIGASSFPSRVFKGQRMAGRMGKDFVTVKNLKVVGIDMDRNYLLIRGAVPGKQNNLVKVFVP